MTQESVARTVADDIPGDEHSNTKNMLGPILCWAVVFADIGTSIYYVPGILYQTVQSLAGFFVSLTLLVFILLTLKYTEVTHRFPQGGGVVTVAAQALNPWFGALGGMFILVDYFLTAAISSLSGMQYLSVVIIPLGAMVTIPGLGQIQLVILGVTIGVLILLGLLNWVGISESAKVSFVGALIAFFSDIAILITVFTHISFTDFMALIPKMFASHALTPLSFLAGFAGSFLAFSGLESISQLSPVMKHPHKKVAGMAMVLVVITIGLTSPLLTILSTLLLPEAAKDPVLSAQIISLLGGKFGGVILQTEVAISASALLIFASNTAIIGAYHVFMALSRMGFLPGVILKRNKLRGTPHFSIALATGIPIAILIAVAGNINILGDMYAFGLLGAFTLTCLGLDIVRARDWRRAREAARAGAATAHGGTSYLINGQAKPVTSTHDLQLGGVPLPTTDTQGTFSSNGAAKSSTASSATVALVQETRGLWFKIDFYLGILTTFLVAVAWSTNLLTKPLATAFGGGVAILGMVIAYFNYVYSREHGIIPVPLVITRIEEPIPGAILAVLTAGNGRNNAVIRAAVNDSEGSKPVIFLYMGKRQPRTAAPRMMEIVDPYLEDQQAKASFGKAENLARKAKIPERKYVYLQDEPQVVGQIWQLVRPQDTVVSAEENQQLKDINPDRIRYELTPDGKVAHLLKRW
jgi:amino acid transporter